MKLITFTVPCYNSAAYMDRCVETLLPAGEEAEIILVDDGSKDDTGKIADAYAEKYPNIVKVIHQENGGHGEGVNQGIRNASGMYFKVVDSDDWLDAEALQKIMQTLRGFAAMEQPVDLLMQLRQRTIWESEFLVLGYGRIGRAVAQRLQALGGQVTIAARAPEQRAAARCAGLHAAPLTALEQLLPHFDAVINTIPAPVLGAAQLRCLPRGALILDLASRPGGTDFAAARELGLRAEHALSLPARCAPETAGALVAHTVEVILQERAATARSERGVS